MPSSSRRKKLALLKLDWHPFESEVGSYTSILFWFNEVTSQDFAMALNISLLFIFTIVLTSYFANPSIIHLICVHQINNLLLHELNQKWFHNATTYILLHCKCTNCEKSSKLECGMYILEFFHEMASRSKSYVQSNSRYDMNDISQTANLLETQFVERYNHRIIEYTYSLWEFEMSYLKVMTRDI